MIYYIKYLRKSNLRFPDLPLFHRNVKECPVEHRRVRLEVTIITPAKEYGPVIYE